MHVEHADLHDKLWELAKRRLRALARHKERYIKAWVAAHGGIDPRDAELVHQRMGDGNEHIRIEFRRDTDRVAALVKAARRFYEEYDEFEEDSVSEAAVKALSEALKPFDGS